MVTADPAGAPSGQEKHRSFVEDFAEHWHESGMGRMEGRVMGYLLVADADRVSTAELTQKLGSAAGAISMATRSLVVQGFIRRRRVSGDRSHYFSADDDVWGGFLSAERTWVRRMEGVLADAGGDRQLTTAARHRILVAREYMRWLGTYNQQMLQDWRKHLAEHLDSIDAQARSEEP